MDNNIFKQVGDNILYTLSQQGKTQQFLADYLGISKQVMSKIIAGAKAINVAEISKIAKALDVSVDCLLEVTLEKTKAHQFSFMGKVENEETRKKIELVKTIIDEILWIEEYANA